MFKTYYNLAKPGIIYGNLITTVAAYFFASRWQVNAENFLGTVFGLGFVIASACVINNYLDRDIDKNMERTKDRALATGAISNTNAFVFAGVLGVVGFALLLVFVNVLAALVALAGFLIYVFVYSFSKRTTHWATEIGSLAGAVPIVVGYVAVADRLDLVALILFLILALWQMPHFFSIATYRSREYAAAGIPVLPLRKGTHETKRQILLYIIGFALAASLLTFLGYAGYAYVLVVELAALVWFGFATQGFTAENEDAWARKLFFISLAVLLVFSVALSFASVLP
ncbi:MAG TPA: heme o synthase [Candidatus Paceibacterota bacterium]|nr:heme o synthase [Candidatus Paceibacterota bacterium]